MTTKQLADYLTANLPAALGGYAVTEDAKAKKVFVTYYYRKRSPRMPKLIYAVKFGHHKLTGREQVGVTCNGAAVASLPASAAAQSALSIVVAHAEAAGVAFAKEGVK